MYNIRLLWQTTSPYFCLILWTPSSITNMHTAITENNRLPQRQLPLIFEWGGWKNSHKSAWVCLSWQPVHDFQSVSLNTFYFTSSQKLQVTSKAQYWEIRYWTSKSSYTKHPWAKMSQNTCAYIRGFNEQMHKEAQEINSGGITWMKSVSSLPLSHMIMPAYPMLLTTLGSTWDAKTIPGMKGQVLSPEVHGL